MIVASLLKELTDAGFSPVSSALLIAIVALATTVKFLFAKNEAARSEAHTQTRQQLEELKDHIDDCDRDRENLRVEQATLKERVTRLTSCPRKDCPMRLP